MDIFFSQISIFIDAIYTEKHTINIEYANYLPYRCFQNFLELRYIHMEGRREWKREIECKKFMIRLYGLLETIYTFQHISIIY